MPETLQPRDSMSKKERTKRSEQSNGQSLDTLISGSPEREVVERAVQSYIQGLSRFVSPAELNESPLVILAKIKDVVGMRIESVAPLITDIIVSINERAEAVNSGAYKQLVLEENRQWKNPDDPDLEHGVRACVDAGIPREAVVGSEGHMC